VLNDNDAETDARVGEHREHVSVADVRAGRREWCGLAVLGLPTLLVSMDLTVLQLAVPQLSAGLQPSSSQLLWIVDIYGFMVAGSLITMGTLGDRIGRRRLLLIGAAGFGAASVLAAFSTSAAMLIAARALLGLAGATLLPSTLALIRNMFVDPRQRALSIGVWAAVFSAGTAIGPVVGGVLLDEFWWGSVFLIGVPVMVALLALGPVLLPEFRDPHAGRLDLTSAVLSLAGVLAAIYGLKQIAENGWGSVPALSIAAGAGVGVVFVLRQRRLTDPLIDLRLFRVPAFSASLAIESLALFAWVGTYFFLAQYLQLVLNLSPLAAGLWLLPAAGGSIIGSTLAPVLVRRVPPAFVLGVSLAVAAFGFAIITQLDGASDLALLVTGSVVFSVGVAPAVVLGTDLIVGAAPPERAGAASAISETGTEFGLALGVAIIGSVGTAVYRSDVHDAIAAGIPASAAEAARDTLGGALAVAEQLPGPLGAELANVARVAFTHGVQVTAATSAGIAAGIAILATILLRRVRASSDALSEAPNDQPDRSMQGGTGMSLGGDKRKVIESTLVSVDGVIGDPHMWTGEHFGEEAVARALEQLGRTDAMVMGRRTYEMFSNIWANPVDEYAGAIYSMRKYVFSSTLARADWNNTTVISGDAVSAMHDLKEQGGKDIVLYGHGSLGQALLEANLLDELKLWIHPVVVGHGKLLFRDGKKSALDLVATDTTTSGVVIVTYRPAGV
jgi:DHA2 family multidrug resistance protein-like MFS transporter